jgi:hypothetical protein
MKTNRYQRTALAVGTLLGAAVGLPTARATLVIATASQTNGTDSLPHTFTPSASDLINGLASSAQAGNFSQEGTGGTGVLTNGSFPSPITRDAGGPFQFAAFATGGNGGGTSVTYTLASPANLTNIVTYGGWQDQGRDQQAYSVLYATAAAPTIFVPLGTVDFNPPDALGHPQVTRVTLTDTTGVLAAGVKALRFDFNTTENGYSGYSEIDVNGTSIPEPTAIGLVGCVAGAGLLRRRRA